MFYFASVKSRRKQMLIAAAAMGVATASQALAIDRSWSGVNSGGSATDVNDPFNWTGSTVPGSGDKAIFSFVLGSTAALDIPTTADAFLPDSITLAGGGGNVTAITSSLRINKNLTLTSLGVAASGTVANNYLNRLMISSTRSTTLELTGANPIDVTGLAGWRTINAASNGFYTTFNLSNTNITFKTLATANAPTVDKAVGSAAGIQGGQFQQASIAANPQMNFTAPTGTITLQTASSRLEGTLGLGLTQLGVYSTQTWVATLDGQGNNTSFIRMAWRQGTTGIAGPEMIRALDSQPLTNLSSVNIFLDTGLVNANSDATTGMRIAPGTYGGLLFTSERDNNGTLNYLKLNGDVTFSGKAVEQGFFDTNTVNARTPATVSVYGLVIRGGDFAGSNNFQTKKRLDLNGKTLTVTNGINLDDKTLAATTARAYAQIDASNSTLTTSNFVISSITQGGSNANVTFNMGIFGNSSTVVNLSGNYSTNVASPTVTGTTQGLSAATINLVGGNASVKSFEVATYSAQTLFNTAYALGTVNVGTVATPALVQLVNNSVNDNTTAIAGHSGSATGEKLMVSNLAIAANSTLDVNAQVVRIGTSLAIASGGTLDLNTGLVLINGTLVTSFVGSGDQTAMWNAATLIAENGQSYARGVVDSDNPGFGFLATASSGTTVWQAVLVPEPTSLTALLLGGLALGRRRRRRT